MKLPHNQGAPVLKQPEWPDIYLALYGSILYKEWAKNNKYIRISLSCYSLIKYIKEIHPFDPAYS
jgi:hypothetical protein